MEKDIIIDLESDINSKKIYFLIKRVLDFFMALIGVVLLSPVYLILFIIIKIDSRGPAIFKQTRVGKDGREFRIYKFRTMIINAEKKRTLEIDPKNLDKFVFQSKNDNRITKVGAFLRQTSLDELPQLVNVLIGDMSFVGPRPEIPDVVKFYPENYKQRLLVTPGITGLAQISGRGEIELGKTIGYDLTYIKNFSIYYDFKILLKTVTAVFKHDGAF